jgi:hypothetical protein
MLMPRITQGSIVVWSAHNGSQGGPARRMSLQDVHAAIWSRASSSTNAITPAVYQVYAHLRNLGYIVLLPSDGMCLFVCAPLIAPCQPCAIPTAKETTPSNTITFWSTSLLLMTRLWTYAMSTCTKIVAASKFMLHTWFPLELYPSFGEFHLCLSALVPFFENFNGNKDARNNRCYSTTAQGALVPMDSARHCQASAASSLPPGILPIRYVCIQEIPSRPSPFSRVGGGAMRPPIRLDSARLVYGV